MECIGELVDISTSVSDKYVLSVKAQTGISQDSSTSERIPGYEYWMIFSDSNVYMKRVQTSALFNNPTRVPLEGLGPAGLHVETCGATPLCSAGEVREALKRWQPIVAQTEFTSGDQRGAFRIEYPVKWADYQTEGNGFRVETGPVILLDPDTNRVGEVPKFEDFRWAHLDYDSFDTVRCLIERSTPILEGATYSSQIAGAGPELPPMGVEAIENRLFSGWDPPLPVPEMKRLFETDRYTELKEYSVKTQLFAVDRR